MCPFFVVNNHCKRTTTLLATFVSERTRLRYEVIPNTRHEWALAKRLLWLKRAIDGKEKDCSVLLLQSFLIRRVATFVQKIVAYFSSWSSI